MFACSTGSKIVSLCASPTLDANSGALTYRFGTKGKLELSYPQPGVNPQQAFSGGVTGYSGGGADYIRFTVGDTAYTLFSDYYRGRENDGLVIERSGKMISMLRCRAGAMDAREGWSRIYKAKLPRYEGQFDVPGAR